MRGKGLSSKISPVTMTAVTPKTVVVWLLHVVLGVCIAPIFYGIINIRQPILCSDLQQF